jgi:catechol 2,3-dioxygenase-like lactoylglutathione lyase family enzyme
MEKVTGIGGVFFKVSDPARMSAWYRDHLGIENEGGHFQFAWREHEPPNASACTVWSLFPADTDYFGPNLQPCMVNYRVANLARMLEQLRSAGIAIEKVEEHDYGNFAWITDPEGNRIELWEPKETTPKT